MPENIFFKSTGNLKTFKFSNIYLKTSHFRKARKLKVSLTANERQKRVISHPAWKLAKK